MDVENKSIQEVGVSDESGKDLNSDEEIQLLNATTPSAKNPCTPVNVDSKSPKTPSTNTKKRKRLSSKEREERERDRQEKRAKLEEEKQKREDEKQRREEERKAKLQQKEEERLQREEEKRKKQEEDEKRKKEKEEEKRVKEEERKKKLEEEEKRKKEKEEEKRMKEEERKKKLEEEEKRKKEKEEERLKKQAEKDRDKKKDEEKLAKQAKLFQNFFQKSPALAKTPASRSSLTQVGGDQQNVTISADSSFKSTTDSSANHNVFKPIMFEVKSNMGLAPTLRRSKLSVEETRAFDLQCLSEGNLNELELQSTEDEPMDIDGPTSLNKSQDASHYLLYLKQHGGRKYCRTDLQTEAEVQIISNDIIENPKSQGLVKWRYKLLQFKENQRPAYWGTWKKLSTVVTARRPLAQEKEVDYDFDSDDEWEEEPEDAEDLANSDKEDEHENDSEEDDEDGWLVPHGYVSDDEGANDEHLDKEDLKIKEKDYFDGLKKQIKILLPEIQTDRFTECRIIFSPLRKKWKETCAAAAAAEAASATKSVEMEDIVEMAV